MPRRVSLLLLGISLSACGATITQRGNGLYESSAKRPTLVDSHVIAAAREGAREYCEERGGHLRVISAKAKRIWGIDTNPMTANAQPGTKKEGTVVFRCD
jgi:hypothetical protein